MNKILKNIPSNLEGKLFEEYTNMKRHFQLDDCGPSQLNGGRLAEAILRIFQHLLGTPVTPIDQEINSHEKTRILHNVTNSHNIDAHIRQKTTVLTKLLLDFRNNRDSGHLGGISANKIDASYVLSCTNWIVAEFIRVYGNYSMDEAQEVIDKIATPNYPTIFDIEGEEFIARNDLSVEQEILVLLSKNKCDFDFLFSKTRDSNMTRFSKKMVSMERKKLIALKGTHYHLLPNGIKEVQTEGLLNNV